MFHFKKNHIRERERESKLTRLISFFKKESQKPFFYSALFFASLFLIIFALDAVFAWNSPTSGPPNSADQALYINTSGNVGIGTASPLRNLHINTPGAEASIVLTRADGLANNKNWRIMSQNAGAGTAGNLIFDLLNDAGSAVTINVMNLLANGNVGIGTASPGKRLEVYNPGVVEDTTIKVNNQTSPGYSSAVELAVATNIQWNLRAGGSGRGDWANSSFSIEEGALGVTPRLVIKNGGNVGIGTTAPGSKLDVNGELRVGNGNIRLYSNGGAGIIQDTEGIPLYFQTRPVGGSAQNRMAIDSTGNVGIGTASPAYRLDLGGGYLGNGYLNQTGCYWNDGMGWDTGPNDVYCSNGYYAAGLKREDSNMDVKTIGIYCCKL